MDSIFKAYDVRGKVGSELTAEVVEKIGRALADWLPQDGAVAVGRDMRPDSAELAAAVVEGLLKQGREVIDIGEVTSDMIYFAVGHLQIAGGAMVTASHNPGEYNGIKICKDGAQPIGEESGLFEIRDLAKASNFREAISRGNVSLKDVSEDWIQHVLKFIDVDKLQPVKIAVDAGNGMAGKIFPEMEPYVPWEVIEMYFELDGTFPNHIANPLEPKNLIDLQEKVKQEKCFGGIAFDGDGDRAVLIDEKGEALSGTVMTAILAEHFLSKNPGSTILHNAICGRSAVEAIEKAGGKAVRTRVGHSFIKADMRKHKAVFAGEHSGHFYFKDNFMADSGLLAAVIGLFVASSKGLSLSELAKPFRQAYVQIAETNFEVQDKQSVLDKIAEMYPDAKQDWLDGLTLNFEDGWCNVRPSNTESLLRLNVEWKNEAGLKKITEEITKIINS